MFVIALFLAGCGQQNEQDTTASDATGPTMTRDEVIAQGDAACAEFRRKAKPLVDQLLGSSDLGAQAGTLRELAGAAQTPVQRLATVRPPPDGRQALDAYVILASEQIAVIRRAADQLDKGDKASARALLPSVLEKAARLRSLARGYGFKVCGSELDGS